MFDQLPKTWVVSVGVTLGDDLFSIPYPCNWAIKSFASFSSRESK